MKLAYAMTVHKAQGMTLKNMVVNCEYCYQPGQIGVAIGRAERVDCLKVVNFKKTLCRKHPSCISEFYKNFTIGNVRNDYSCCRGRRDKNSDDNGDDDGDHDDHIDNTENTHKINSDDNFNSDSDFSESEIENLNF